jgi:hypothetical protein
MTQPPVRGFCWELVFKRSLTAERCNRRSKRLDIEGLDSTLFGLRANDGSESRLLAGPTQWHNQLHPSGACPPARQSDGWRRPPKGWLPLSRLRG